MRQWLVFVLAFFVMGGALMFAPGNSSALSTSSRKVCGGVKPGFARCNAIIVTDSSGFSPLTSGSTKGYTQAVFG